MNARAALNLTMFFSSASPGAYYFFRNSKGDLVISNRKPPAGNKIIRQRDFPEATDSQVPQTNATTNTQSNGAIEGAPKSSNSK